MTVTRSNCRACRRTVLAVVGLAVVGAVLHLAQGQSGSLQGPGERRRHCTSRGRIPHGAHDLFERRRPARVRRLRRVPWWAIDYPEAEFHFRQGVRRLTRIDMADDSRHIALTDDALFDYPWLFAQQVGRWSLSDAETSRLREYLLRGGFMVADDFHGPWQWDVFAEAMRRVFPDRPIVDIPDGHEILHVLLRSRRAHADSGPAHDPARTGGGRIEIYPEGSPPRWRGIYDDQHRLMVVMNFNMDMGDAWEHADDPVYPEPMTALAYRFGINYVGVCDDSLSNVPSRNFAGGDRSKQPFQKCS